MQYIALLRGVNVGGKMRVDMAKLRQVFEDADCTNVLTYINSGNVVFNDKRPIPTLQALLSTALEASFGVRIPLILRSRESFIALASQVPADWVNDTVSRTDIIFVGDTLNAQEIIEAIGSKPAVESVIVTDDALVWHVSRQNATKSSMLKLIGGPYYSSVTIRNINTVRKLIALLE